MVATRILFSISVSGALFLVLEVYRLSNGTREVSKCRCATHFHLFDLTSTSMISAIPDVGARRSISLKEIVMRSRHVGALLAALICVGSSLMPAARAAEPAKTAISDEANTAVQQ